jgi:hypothetical protein
MGFVSLFAGSNYGGGMGNLGSSRKPETVSISVSIRELIAQFNTEALKFISQYGNFIGIAFILIYALCLLFAYLNSIFTFVFIEGIVKKELQIKKSFSDNKNLGTSLFFLRFIVGLITMGGLVIIFYPVISAFFNNTLADFNLWSLLPIGVELIVFLFILMIFMFLVYDFVIPIMYLKKFTFGSAWNYFIKLLSKNKLQILIYWFMKLVLSIGAGILSIMIAIPLLIILIPLIIIGVLIYLGSYAVVGLIPAIIITGICGFVVLVLFIYVSAVVFVPLPAFFRLYSIEMVKKLEG